MIIIEQDIKVCLLPDFSGAAINQGDALKFSTGNKTSVLIKCQTQAGDCDSVLTAELLLQSAEQMTFLGKGGASSCKFAKQKSHAWKCWCVLPRCNG